MGFHLLGPVELWDDGRRIDLGSGKQRAVLAVLLAHAGKPVSVEVLIDRVWGDQPPSQVRNALYSYVSRIRKALKETAQLDYVLHQRNGGYVLDVPAEAVDMHRFEAALGQARSTDDPQTRIKLLRDALDCWRGTALQDVSGRWAEEARQALIRKRIGACADWAEAMIELGRHSETVEELEREFVEHPQAEPIAAQLMTALHRLGRQAEALARYAALRERLAEDLGAEPGKALQQLHLRILRDPEQDSTEEETTAPAPQQVDQARRRLADAAAEWDQHARDDSMVYRGARLAAWRERDSSQLNDLERAFLAASDDVESHERAARRRRMHVALVSLSFALVVMLLLVVVIAVESTQADRQRDRAMAGQLAATARSQLARDPELSLMLARRAVEIDPNEAAQAVLAQALLESRVRARWQHHHGPVTTLDVNGTRAVSGGEDGRLHIWSTDGSTRPIDVQAHSAPVRDVAFSTFGDRIASVGEDGSLRILSMDGNPIATIEDANVTAAAWPTDGKWIAGAGKDGVIRAWPADGRGPARQFAKHTGAATAVDWSPSNLLVSAGDDGKLIIHDVITGAERVRTNPGGPLLTLDVSPNGKHVITGDADGYTRIWPTDSDAPPAERRDHRDAVHSVAYSKNGQYVITGGHDRSAHVRMADGNGDSVVLRGSGGPIQSVVFTDDSLRVLTASDDGTVRAWDTSVKPNLEVLRAHRDATADVAFLADGETIASVGLDGTFWLQDEMKQVGTPMRAVAVSPDGRHVVMAGDAGTVMVWPRFEKREPWRIDTGYAGKIESVAFSPDSTTVATVGEDGVVRLSQLSHGVTRVAYQTYGGPGHAVAFSADGRFLASAHEDGGIRLWQPTGSDEPILLRGPEEMRAIVFSPDGNFVAGAGNDGTIRVWPTSGKGAPVLLNGHFGRVNDLAFSKDGEYIASVGNDQRVRLWKWAVREEPIVYEQHAPATVTSVDVGAGKRLAAGRSDGTVDIWTCDVCVPVADLLAIARDRVTRDFTPDERRIYLDWRE